jgi:hypothetical protein
MYFYGDESEIDLEKFGEQEFSEWKWMPLEELPLEVIYLSPKPSYLSFLDGSNHCSNHRISLHAGTF